MIETVPGLLRAAARQWPHKTALRSMNDPAVTFAEFDAASDRFAKALIADGMTHGERLGIWAPNMWEWVVAAVGAQRIGGTLVPLNPRLRAAEVEDIVSRGNVTRLVTLGDTGHPGSYVDQLAKLDLPKLKRVVLLRPNKPNGNSPAMSLDSFLALGTSVTDAALHEREAQVNGDTIADILFTSGTTGKPKGAVFNHRPTVFSSYNMINFARVSDADCLCPLGPFAHLAGYKAGWVNGFLTGATVVWNDAHDAESVLNAISTLRISVMPAAPIVWQNIIDHPNRRDWNIASLRFAATGSTTIPPALVRRMIKDLGVEQVGTGYGLTESGGLTNFSRIDDSVENVVSTSGRAAPDAEVCIIAPDGRRLGPNETGEILVRTRRQLLEYLDNPEATRAAIDDEGWLHTGDVGSLDAEGYLKITDRLKDMYITNGFNVYPAEVERLLGTIEGISQVAVVGVPESRKGEVGHAFLVRSPGSTIAEAEVIAWCKQNIANYKIPAAITFVEDLPRNSLGKVVKRELTPLL